MFRDLAVTIANVIVLFLGFRDLVLSYNFGISKFTDSFLVFIFLLRILML